MSSEFEIIAETRTDLGKGASRRLRRLEEKVPGIIYGNDITPVSISLISKDLVKALENEAFFTHILSVSIDGKAEQAVIKDLQRHPSKGYPLHIDFQRVDADHKLHMNVPLHFLNEESCPGVKQDGGIIAHLLTEVEITCLPKDLPEFIEVDLAAISLGQTLHLTDLTLPTGVELVAFTHGNEHDHDQPICNVHAPRGETVVADDDTASEEDESKTEES